MCMHRLYLSSCRRNLLFFTRFSAMCGAILSAALTSCRPTISSPTKPLRSHTEARRTRDSTYTAVTSLKRPADSGPGRGEEEAERSDDEEEDGEGPEEEGGASAFFLWLYSLASSMRVVSTTRENMLQLVMTSPSPSRRCPTARESIVEWSVKWSGLEEKKDMRR
jgi:hypothetical protein